MNNKNFVQLYHTITYTIYTSKRLQFASFNIVFKVIKDTLYLNGFKIIEQ